MSEHDPSKYTFTNKADTRHIPAIRGANDHGATALNKEHTAWDVYNKEAKKVDIELVKDWKESLNSLLLFVSWFNVYTMIY
jgi:hypothetical protein